MGTFLEALLPSARMTVGFGEILLCGVEAADFGRKPAGIDMNCPAFIYGHLSLYPDRLLAMVGREDLARPADPSWQELFAAGKACQDDQDGAIYPPMDAITSAFRDRHEVLLGALAGVDESVFDRENPLAGMRDRGITTIGGAATFMLTSHLMVHFGQMSAWRRAFGLGSAM